jgi:hypothetical protein
MLLTILIILAVIVVIFFVVVALQSEDFKISRSATVAATPAEVFPQVNDFHCWDNWSPWAKIDPAMKVTYGGPASGEGSTYSWSGNNKAGEGKMTNLKSQPSNLIRIQLDFLKPWKATNNVEFSFNPDSQGTLVTWTMTGKKNFFMKGFHLIMNMDKMLGPDFEKGLAQLKGVVETAKT